RPYISTLFPYTTLFRSCALAPEFHDTLAVDLDHVQGAECALQHLERGVLGSTWRLAHFRHVADMEVDQVAEGLELADARLRGRRSEEHTSELQSRENLV